jgi:hypothetical protein
MEAGRRGGGEAGKRGGGEAGRQGSMEEGNWNLYKLYLYLPVRTDFSQF